MPETFHRSPIECRVKSFIKWNPVHPKDTWFLETKSSHNSSKFLQYRHRLWYITQIIHTLRALFCIIVVRWWSVLLIFVKFTLLALGHHDVITWEHFPRHWPCVRGIDRSPMNSPDKGQWRVALMFSMICAWTNAHVNNRDAGDLRCHRADYDVTVTDSHSTFPVPVTNIGTYITRDH